MSNLPENENDLLYLGNEQLIKTALVNIMENAMKYGANQEVVTTLEFNPGTGPVICVVDKGIGMEKKKLIWF